MEKNTVLYFEEMTESDIPELSRIMKRAFDEDSRIHLNREGGPEGYDNGDFLRKWGLHKDSTAFKISSGPRLVGAVILWIGSDGNFLGNMFVDADLQNQGIGTRIWKQIESLYPETSVWKTETPGFSKRNHHFYIGKCGFTLARIENEGSGIDENYILEKRMRQMPA